ncbi:T-complex protein 1 subunit gamma [Coelomomyces lativittatus]|nr:T-complex protein 1 subunit gamma [Coelomomyces lativittatus]
MFSLLAGEFLAAAAPFLEKKIHPIVIISAFKKALEDALKVIDSIAKPMDVNNKESMLHLIRSTLGTKFVSRWSDLMCQLALEAVNTITVKGNGDQNEVDIKRYARIEKVPGGEIEESKVIRGIMLNKDVTHPKMRRRIEKAKVLLLDCPLEYKKGESQTNIELSHTTDWNRVLEIEEEQVQQLCAHIAKWKPDIVVTEKGVSDLAQHYLLQHNITALRRVRKTDNHRLSRALNATIVNKVEDIKASDLGQCGLFHIDLLGDEYFAFFDECDAPKACTLLLRGPSKDILNEIERNLMDAMCVARNVLFHPQLVPGGGATEMAVSVQLTQLAKSIEGHLHWPYKAMAEACEVIARTLVLNCGGNPIKTLTHLKAKQATSGGHVFGVDGISGQVVDMTTFGIWEPWLVKTQTFKTAIEAACLLLRVDDIVSGINTKKNKSDGSGMVASDEQMDDMKEM